MKKLGFIASILISLMTSNLTAGPDTYEKPVKLNFCAAIRGNGTYIYSHFGAIARIVEEYGEFDALSGGSSGAVSAFLYESIAMNPLLKDLSQSDRKLYISTMFKSMSGFLKFLSTTEEAKAISYLSDIADTARRENLYGLFKINWFKAAKRLFKLLNDEDIKNLINPEVLKDLNILHDDAPDSYKNRIEDILISLSSLSTFIANDSSIFFREGIVSFKGFSKLIGKTGNFFAGSEPEANKKLSKFLSLCAKNSKGKTWNQISGLVVKANETCENLYLDAIRTFKRTLESNPSAIAEKDDRLKHKIGKFLPVFVPAAVMEDSEQIEHYSDSLERYYHGEDPQFRPDFSKIDFGYFIPSSYEDFLIKDLKMMFPNDLKSQKAHLINRNRSVVWEKVLQLSPLEPGLGKIKILAGGDQAFIGGFSDLHPVQILRAAKCEKVIFLNRIGVESSFVASQRSLEAVEWKERNGVAELLNITIEDHDRLYRNANPENSYQTAINQADAVWCTDWDNWKANEINEMLLHSYGNIATKEGPNKGHKSALQIISKNHESFFLESGLPVTKRHLVGCSKR